MSHDYTRGGRLLALSTLGVLFLGFSTPGARAQSAPQATAQEADLSEVVVTGTRIRGVAPVGSTVVQLDQEDLAKQGLISVADTLNTVPFVLKEGAGNDYAGGGGNGPATLNGLAFNKSPNLRGFGPQATLSLVDGHRVPYEGANMNAFDGDNIPAQMLQRVEIVADGTSPIYGADAIAGTVNYVLRDPFNGAEAYGQYGSADGQSSWTGTLVGGLKWSTGGVVLSYQHTNSDALHASSRPELYNDDFTPYGGPPSPMYSSPGNVIVNGVPYAIPKGQNGSALTLAQLGPAGAPNVQNGWTGYDAIPGFKRDETALKIKQDVTDWLQLFGDGFYSKRTFDMALIGQGNDVQVTVPNSNYYSPCNRSLLGAPAALVAACGTGSLTVDYNTAFDAGAGPVTRQGYSTSWDGNVGAQLKLPADWSATLQASRGTHDELTNNTYFFGNGLGALPSLGGTTASTAYNVFCDGSAYSCNSSSVTAGITGPNWQIESRFNIKDYSLNLDGPVATLPGGKLRVAVGAERYEGEFINTNNFGVTDDARSVNSGYVEIYVPIVGDGNAVTGIRKLELDVAGRIDSYSDVGSTKNPKIGVNWTPVDGLKLHGSFGTSFRAPGLVDDDPSAQHGYLPPGFAGNSINPSLCPTCAAAGGLVAYQVLGGANHDLQPEKARTYSFGADWTPEFLRGLVLGANYWSVNYTNQVSFPVYNAGAFGAINQQYYNNYIIYNPTFFPTLAASNPTAFFGNFPVNQGIASCAAVYGQKVNTQALFNQLLSCINAGGDGGVFGPPGTPANTAAIEDGHRINAGVTKGQGMDLKALYSWSNAYGDWRVGGNGELILKWMEAPISGAPQLDDVNTYTYPLRFRGRAEFSWSSMLPAGRVGAHLFVNYDSSYHIPAAQLPGGVSSAYTSIDSNTTVDMTLTYDTGDNVWAPIRNSQVILSVQDLFDSNPPLMVNDASTGGIRFDNLVASPLKRVIQLQIGKRW